MLNRILTLTAATAFLATAAFGTVLSTHNVPPVPNSMYVAEQSLTFEVGTFPSVTLSNIRFGSFTNVSSTTCDGICDISFDGTLFMDVAIDGMPAVPVSFTNASSILHIYGYVPGADIPFSNGLRDFQASGTVGTTPFAIRAEMTGGAGGIATLGGGLYLVSSSVDFFPEISLDNGENWVTPTSFVWMDLEAEPVPEPSSMILLASAAGGLGLLARFRRR